MLYWRENGLLWCCISLTAIEAAEQRWKEMKEQGKGGQEEEEEEEDIYTVAKMTEVDTIPSCCS